jgi:hypothetical protein
MKNIFLFTLAAAAMCACTPKTTITVENTLDIDRSAELVEIPTDQLLDKILLGFDENYVVKNAAGEVIPSQVTHDGLLLFQSGLGAGEKANFTVETGAPQEFAAKTKGRHAPERFGDFIWENDRVAFRIYGAPLAAKDGPSNGIDALYKRTEEMILDKWYEGELQNGLSYHDDHGTGLDNYDVKRTLGAGAAAPYIDGKLVLNSNFTGHEILDYGPLRTTFRLSYPELAINGVPAAETRTFSIDAGSQLTRVEQEWGVGAPMTVAVGYPLRDGAETKYAATGNVFMLEEPANSKVSGVYLGSVLPKAISEVVETEYEVPAGEKGAGVFRSILELTDYAPGTPLVYYTGFGWEKHGGWTAETFAEYLDNFNAALETPFVVTVK